jgi:hypothetical protein
LIFGIVILWLLLRLEQPVVKWIKKYPSGIQILISFLSSMLLIVIVVLASYSLGSWSLPKEWITNAQLAFPDEPALNPLSVYNYLTATGAFFGLATGWIWISRLGGFSIKDETWKLVLRYLVGLVGILILYMGLGLLLNHSESLISYTLKYIQYALIGFWMSGFAPWLFVKLKLARRLK